MKNQIISLALIAGLSACGGGNPFDEVETETDTPDGEVVGDGEGTGINRDGIPPGTASPSPQEALFRSEPKPAADEANFGNGFATGITYDSGNDTFAVDNIAFDGDSPYTRRDASGNLNVVSSLNNGEFAVYESPATATDPVNGQEVSQFVYRAVYGVSRNRITNSDGTTSTVPTTQFAIVRTGSYINYGFGGFIYQRDTDVTLPSSLQARFEGKSAGLRDSNAGGPLQYTTADVVLNIDYQDFNDGADIRGDGVKGRVFNRLIYDLDGVDVTSEVAGEILEGNTSIPDALLDVGPDVLDNNGDLITSIQSNFPVNADGSGGEVYESGTFYAIVSGDSPDEIVGVFVLESSDADSRDTGGFIVYRDPAQQP